VFVLVARPDPQKAIEVLDGLGPQRKYASLPSLAQYEQLAMLETDDV